MVSRFTHFNSVYTYWEAEKGIFCPVCGEKLTQECNDGGKEVITLEGPVWVITNYYKCTNLACDLHKAFPMTHSSCIKHKRHSVEVWAKVIQHNFKSHLNYRQVAELLWEFRSKGLEMIIADNRPSVLFQSVPGSASLKVLFRLAYPCNEIFTNDSEEKEMLLQLENRKALVMDGTTGNKYLIKTLDVSKLKEEM